jgi:hypothetical protein
MSVAASDRPRRAPADSTIAAKVERPVVDRLREAARANDRSLSGQIRVALRAWVEAENAARRHDAAVASTTERSQA